MKLIQDFYPVTNKTDMVLPVAQRFFKAFTPIQGYNNHPKNGYIEPKSSDVVDYLIDPISELLHVPVLLLDAGINLINCIASLAHATYLFMTSITHAQAKNELKDSGFHLLHAVTSLMTALINPLLSILGWLTRPLASAAQYGKELMSPEKEYREGPRSV